MNFDDHFFIRKTPPIGYRAFNKKTGQPASPIYNDPNAAQYYVEQELKLEMEEQIEEMLTDEITKV